MFNKIAAEPGGSLDSNSDGPILTGDPSQTVADIISSAVGLMTVIAGIYFLFVILSGAIAIISSGGDKGAYEEGRKRITAGAIGFTVAIAAIFIFGLIGIILGVDFMNIKSIIDAL